MAEGEDYFSSIYTPPKQHPCLKVLSSCGQSRASKPAMRCRIISKTLRGWLGINSCCLLLLTLGIFILYRNQSHPASGYRLEIRDVTHASPESKKVDPAFAQASGLSIEPTGGGSIPKILHQVFASERVYSNYKPYIAGCLSLNPDWEYYLWTDADAEKLISDKYPTFMAKYRKYTDNLEKSDSIRYMILHHMGGIYLDMDVECLKPFFPALASIQAFIDQERTEQTSIHFLKPYSAMNSAMGGRPGHPFFQHVINAIRDMKWVGDALRTTGPMVLTRAYETYSGRAGNPPVTLMDPRVFSPLMTNMPEWRRKCQFPLASAKGRPTRSLSPQQRGCLLLESKQWRSDDRDNSTIGVHRFLHLGYGWLGGRSRKGLFSVASEFPGRVKFYRNVSTNH